MRDLARWRALTPRERRDLAVCAAAMPFVVTGLRLLGLARVQALFATFPMLRRPRAARAADEAAARARSLARTVGIAARRGPFTGTAWRDRSFFMGCSSGKGSRPRSGSG